MTLFVWCVAVLAAGPGAAERRSITVNGDAEVKVAPDQVILSLAVESSDKDLLTAKRQNDERVKKVLAVTQQFKIDSKHVQTDQISIDPRYERYQDKTTFLGYFVRKSIVICLKDLPRFEEVLTELLKAGTNSVPGIEFQSTELRKHRDRARSMAAKAAREKATAVAAELGARVGKAYSIRENSVSSWGGRTAYQNVMNEAGNAGGETDPTPGGFAPGQISIKASLTVDFDLEG